MNARLKLVGSDNGQEEKERPALWLESWTTRDLVAFVSWGRGSIEVHLERGSLGEGFSLMLDGHEDADDADDRTELRVVPVELAKIETVIALHHALGRLITQARDVGWHSHAVVGQHGGDLPEAERDGAGEKERTIAL